MGRAVQVERLQLAALPTPVQPLNRLAGALGRSPGSLLVKRDDLTGVGGGGNKTRKLEYVAARAQQEGCDWLVTGAAPQSNACRQTAAVATMLGWGCSLVLAGDPPQRETGNVVLDRVLGAHLVWTGPLDGDAHADAMDAEMERVRDAGHRPHLVAVGASTPLGALGYVEAAAELRAQVPAVQCVITATGSAATHAGLAAGLGDHELVLGIRVGERQALAERVEHLARAAAELAGLPAPAGACRLDDGQLGSGYGAHTAAAAEAMQLAARTEGLLLDPVYTAKAMAGLVAAARAGRLPDGPVVFLHTGGLPGLLSDEHGGWAAEQARQAGDGRPAPW